MELLKTIQTRRSIRSFQDKPVADELLTEIIQAAMLAPSAGNQQPWHFLVVNDRNTLNKVPEFHPYCKMIAEAPVAIVICGEPEGLKWPAFWVQDCSAATQNLLLAARALGLGTVWAGVYPEETRMSGARKLFNIPEDIIPFAIVPIGWPDVDFKPMDRFRPERIHQNSW
jgi:nitroreductase